MANLILQLKAKHFEGTEFVCGECAIEKAYKDQTGNKGEETVTLLWDKTLSKDLKHKPYTIAKFDSDKIKAQSHNFNETVIREIELIEV